MDNQKQWYRSKTLWWTLLKAIGGVLTIFISTNPTVQGVGGLVIVSQIINAILRYGTTTAIE